MNVDDRFWQKVNKTDECWIWTAGTDKDGYGKFRARDPRRTLRAHRVAWQLSHGPIPAGTLVLHRCDNPPCVNPDHLWLGTQADNIADRDAKDRRPDIRRTHCKHGHEYTAENTMNLSDGSRRCRTCHNEADRRTRIKRRAS